MATLRDYVRRFRPAGTPGAAAPAGVPVDRVAERAVELAPVFEALRGATEEATDLVATARREADRRRAASVEDANVRLAEARQRAEAVRATAAAKAVADAAEERAALLDGARRDAAEVAGRAAEQLPLLVDRIVAVVGTAAMDREPTR